HKMARLHRVRLGKTSDTHGPDPARVDEIVRRNGIVYSELEPGDGLFFHCMTLHGSEANLSDRTRTVIHCSYNAVANQPIPQPGQAHHRYQPLEVVEDDFLATRNYTELYRPRTFHSPESENDPGAGIFYRQSDQDVM
ncbi:MAG: phytanoyl-CoA dioxygenase family protein, partial [Nannocystaceae bacterium]